MNDNMSQQFAQWFRQATGHEPYSFHAGFACDPTLPESVQSRPVSARPPWRCWGGCGGDGLKTQEDRL